MLASNIGVNARLFICFNLSVCLVTIFQVTFVVKYIKLLFFFTIIPLNQYIVTDDKEKKKYDNLLK